MYAKATEVLKAGPADDAARIQERMSKRRTLNANKRTAPKQDLSGAVNGAITGRGGNVQQLGKAASARLAQAQPYGSARGVVSAKPPTPQAPGAPPDADLQATQGGSFSVMAPDMPDGARQSMQKPAQLQGDQLMQAMQRRGMPMGGGGVANDPAGGRGFVPPEMVAQLGAAGAGPMAPGAADMVTRPLPGGPMGMETAEMGGQGAQPFGQGIPPQIMQRLQALRGGGMQSGQGPGNPGAPGGGFMGPGQQRSFQDFWQGGMAPRGM